MTSKPDSILPGSELGEDLSTSSSFIAFLTRRGGDMGALMGSIDWEATPVGPMMTWPQSLRTAINMCLSSGFPMLILWGPEHVQFYNDAFRPILGAKHPQSMGQCARDCWTEIWEVIQPMFAQILAGGQAIWSEDQRFFLDRYGYVEETFFTFSYSPIDDETGKVGGILCTVKETTRQVVSERRMTLLRELAARTGDVHTIEEACQSALTVLACGSADLPFALLYLLDSEGKQAHLMGTTGLDAALLDIRTSLALDESSAELALYPFVQVRHTRAPTVITDLSACLVPHDAQQAITHHSACLVPLVRSAEAPLAGVLVAGISPHHAFDEEYRGFFALVATHLATALSNARTHEEEHQRAEALAELDRAKTAFFSNISHEFRTPLTLSLGPLEALLSDHEHPLDEEQRAQIEMVRRNTQRQLKLVNTLLDFARIEAGRAEAAYQPIDLAQLTADLASAFRSAMERAGLQFIVDCPPLPEPIYVDRQMWEKIVLNLLSNALKYTFSGCIRVSLSLVEEAVELVVQDSGVGIGKEDLPHLFERFYRAHAPSARTQEGSGIGLALVQELVRLHKGTLTVESEPGIGTTFLVRLPTGYSHLPADRLDPHASPGGAALLADMYVDEALHWFPEALPVAEQKAGTPPPAASFSTLTPSQDRANACPEPPARLLVVDDNADMRSYLFRLLSPSYQVELAADGRTALALAHERHPDLMISDVMMPELDGFTLLTQLRSDSATADIPVMLLSARAGEEATLEGLAAGAQDYLVKPFSARELLARVASRLEIARLRREAELAREHLYTLLQQAPAAVAILRGPDYRVEFANPTMLRIWGRAAEQVLEKSLFAVFPEVQGQESEELLKGVLTTGIPYVGSELKATYDRRGDGRLEDAYFTVVYAPLRSARQGIEGVMVFAYEVTEQVAARKQAEASEAQLRHEQERLSIALASSQTGTFRWNPETGEFLDFDACLKQLFGFAPDEPVRVTEDFLARVHPDDVPAIIPAVDLCRQGADFEQEYRVIHPDGSIHWLYGRAKMQRDASGRPTYLVGACTDITRSKQMEEALLHNVEHLRLLAESMPQKIFTAQPDGDVDYFNPQWSEFTGLPFEEIRAWGWTQFIHLDDLEENLRRWKHALATGEPFYYEHRFRRADGVYRWHVSRAIPIRDDAGTIILWIGANTEIEEQKQLEERKDEFLRMASHDLRNPLTAMKGNLQLAQRQLSRLLSTEEETASRKVLADLSLLLERALRQTDVQQRLIGDLLDVSRIQGGKLELTLGPCDLAPLVREIVLDQQASVPGRTIQLLLPSPDDPVLVLIDAARIGQVISNYLSNALKYSPVSTPVEVGLAVQDGQARLWVRDQGPGLSAEQQQHIWERFYQAPGIVVQSGPSQGMGLGLHICQTLIARHGGTVGVESRPGKGATFWFTLPLVSGEEERDG
jgi:PAS domain S-box-containing protein